ncbi:EF-hand domain-containing protein [Rubritalea spongiae]|uniref:EF-hand domain-containing protein n=1 Tax=Rubritalea spongiae TaxID=430797 RepID=A0ABW5E4H8_9BACT
MKTNTKTNTLILAIAALSLPSLSFAKDHGKKGKHCEKIREHILEKFDADGDGELSEEEREAAKAAMKERKEAFIAKYDTDGDGELSEDEKQAAKDLIIAQYDTDGDGKLSRDERQVAREAGEDLPGPPRGRKGPRGGDE